MSTPGPFSEARYGICENSDYTFAAGELRVRYCYGGLILVLYKILRRSSGSQAHKIQIEKIHRLGRIMERSRIWRRSSKVGVQSHLLFSRFVNIVLFEAGKAGWYWTIVQGLLVPKSYLQESDEVHHHRQETTAEIS